jgi:glycosyltransferase involved in cell wall biosynthesis
MTAAPAVSVITPTRNRAKLLQESLDSVAAQTFADWEHLVVDDGSDDETSQIMAARAAADPRFSYIIRQSPVSGANACRNIGIKAARAPLLVLLDSDDLLEPDCLARRVEVMRRNADLDFATFQGGVFVQRPGDQGRLMDDQLIGDDLTRFLYFETPWQTTAPIWRRDSLIRLGLMDEALLSWQDIELHVRAISAGCRYIRYPQVDHHIRWLFEPTKVSVEQRRSPRHLDGAIDVIERLEAHVRGGPGMNWVRQRALCSLYFFVAELWVEQGELGPGLVAWRRVRARRLGPVGLHLAGSLLLTLKRLGLPTTTAIRKWKGWTRLRTLPEVVPA